MTEINLKRASHASILLMGFVVFKSLLGLVLKRTIAGDFGAGIETDAYFAAFTIPQQLGDFVVGGIIFKVVIPVFQQRREDVGDQEAIKDVSGILNFSALILLFITVAYYFLIPYIIPLLFSGFDSETMQLTLSLSRWLSPAIILMGLSLIYVAFYHAHKSFLVPAISTLMFPISSLIALYALPQEWGIMRLVYGNLIGVSIGIFFLILFLQDKFHWSWNWNLANPALKTTTMVAWPLLIGNLIGKIIPFVQKNAASQLPNPGNLSLLEYAFFLSGTVLIFIASPVTTAIFPLMGEQKARGDEKALIETFHQSVKVVVFLALPCAIFFAMEANDIVALLLQNGKFSTEDTQVCANLIAIIAIMIVPQSINLVMANMFLVYKETKIMAIEGSILALISIPLYFILSKYLGIYGIAITYSAIYAIGAIINIMILQIMHPQIISSSSFILIFKFFVATLLMGCSIYILRYYTININLIIRIVLVGGGASFTYLSVTHLLKISGLKFIFSRLLPKVF
ncbi:MAG: lipid II flippase MurJ [Verrucomicrobiota bacterium]|nr:lipid II flippase MurJ [Verrucomicrobiota bacterium]